MVQRKEFPKIFMVYNNIETQSLRKTVFKMRHISKPDIVAFFEQVNFTPYYEIHGRNM